jgi:hypothetical protein
MNQLRKDVLQKLVAAARCVAEIGSRGKLERAAQTEHCLSIRTVQLLQEPIAKM